MLIKHAIQIFRVTSLIVILFAVSPLAKADIDSNVSLLEEAANNGDIESQTKLGAIYIFGPKEKRNIKKAFFWLDKATEKNYGPAEYLSGMVFMGQKNDSDSIKLGSAYLMKSSMHGCAGASGILGNVFLAASKRNPNLESKAISFVIKGAKGGDYMSRFLLAKLTSTGNKFIKKDLITAHAWLEFSRAEQPNHRASQMTEKLYSSLNEAMSNSDRKKSKNLALDLKNKFGKIKYELCSQSIPDDILKYVVK